MRKRCGKMRKIAARVQLADDSGVELHGLFKSEDCFALADLVLKI
jgi:hypothetical protein